MKSKQQIIKIPQILEPLLQKCLNIQEQPNTRKSSDFFKKSSISQIQGNIYNIESIVQQIQRIQKVIFKYGKSLMRFDDLIKGYEQHAINIQSDQSIMIEQIKEIYEQKGGQKIDQCEDYQELLQQPIINNQIKTYNSFNDDSYSEDDEFVLLK
ncbi:Hypothetical_protein [Hexamita inflata]|uniref:Hypothetical_protein n=1 Tax=Hexamita inflata TaxID=28002 RepID=A0AA86NJ84_9EUKA|nr:Hypothetical protein HINF_LOCUS7901 [Hexamita inflata]